MCARRASVLSALLLGTISSALAQDVTQAPVVPALEWKRAVEAMLVAEEYHFTPGVDGLVAAPNRAEDLRTAVTAHGIEMTSRTGGKGWRFGLSLVRFGRDAELAEVASASVTTRQNRVELARGTDLVEWYVNDPHGLEQGFSIAAPPAGDRHRPVVLEMRVSGLTPSLHDDEVRFEGASGETLLRYSKLLVLDATRAAVPAHLALRGDRLRIVIEDAAATYPLLVDPLVHAQAWTGHG